MQNPHQQKKKANRFFSINNTRFISSETWVGRITFGLIQNSLLLSIWHKTKITIQLKSLFSQNINPLKCKTTTGKDNNLILGVPHKQKNNVLYKFGQDGINVCQGINTASMPKFFVGSSG